MSKVTRSISLYVEDKGIKLGTISEKCRGRRLPGSIH